MPKKDAERVEIDDVDKGILYLLQENARDNTAAAIGDLVGVSASTVSNRINKLERAGVITGYHPTIDYERVGLDHHLLVVGTVPFERRAEIAERALAASGVVTALETLSNRRNLFVEVVRRSKSGVERTLERLNEIGVDVEDVQMKGRELCQPFNHYGKEYVDRQE